MTLDKDLYQQARQWYQQWNEDVLREQVRSAGKLLPKEAWNIYINLWNLTVAASKSSSKIQRKLDLLAWEKYYSRIATFEQWRTRDATRD